MSICCRLNIGFIESYFGWYWQPQWLRKINFRICFEQPLLYMYMYVHMYMMKKLRSIFLRTVKNWQPPGIEPKGL